MVVLFQLFVMYVVLLLLAFAVPALHPILYTTLFFLLAVYVLFTILVPFARTLLAMVEKMPAPTTLLIVSAGLFYMAEVLAGQMKDEGYEAVGQLFQTVMKIVIVTLWLPSVSQLIETIHALIPW
ncbi:hypothetical protein DV702_04515 [Sporosarcina sp. PTS2304]|uniref:SpoIIIAC/SpoIIIAD family protein n=1 Tax=Sporosarcina sp. PTS2304 TaxID=2283194 RepID=UPI000E0DB428|nr:SpoIIIAC/SpoIIIAD family protein [Sporosarcina sp. PTS2304]AXH99060.1 hypothetical protein DV702_04515 [Sporosarcina sp. PTS2304]